MALPSFESCFPGLFDVVRRSLPTADATEAEHNAVVQHAVEDVEAIISAVLPEWSIVDANVKRHILKMFIAAEVRSYYARYVTTQPAMDVILWAVLLHDIEKVVIVKEDGGVVRDPTHPFRSSRTAIRILSRICGATLDPTAVDAWCVMVAEATIMGPSGLQVQDNSKVGAIVAAADALLSDTHQTTAGGCDDLRSVLMITLLHQTLPPVPMFPTFAPMQDAEVPAIFTRRVVELMLPFGLIDSASYYLFNAEKQDRFEGQHNELIARLLALY